MIQAQRVKVQEVGEKVRAIQCVLVIIGDVAVRHLKSVELLAPL